MDLKDYLFAKKEIDSFSVRFVSALKIVSKKYFNGNFNAELMYRMFGTSSAKANDMRAAGLNALLGDVSASGNVGSGAAASAAESAQMMPTDYSFIGDAANHGLAGKQIGRAHV